MKEVFDTPAKALKLKDVLYHQQDQVGNTAVISNRAGQDVIGVQYDVYGLVVACKVPQQRVATATAPLHQTGGAHLITALTTATNPAARLHARWDKPLNV